MKDRTIIALVVLAIGLLVTWLLVYEYKYPCIRGHYEMTAHYIYDANTGGMSTYWSDDFYCDCRTVRDSIKK